VAGVLLAGACFELALALGAGSIGSEPGGDATGQVVVGPIVEVAWLVGIVVACLGARRGERAVSLLAPVLGLYVTATDYTYDPYYAPTERRYADSGAVPVWWIFMLLGVSFTLAFFTWRWPRTGGWITAFGLFVWFVTLVAAGDGH
jgi:hypothetical protein